ncbi:MAG TPA: hypothetical protein VFK89_07205 [Actinomycetota bacterium]|nr:hypothetical protein [Actinomycetota bacterium]
MRKLRALLMAGIVAGFMVFPVTAAHACPDPDNPCDPTAGEVIQHAVCHALHKC